MSIDIYLELDNRITPEEVRAALSEAGARITSQPDTDLTGEFPASTMTFFYDVLKSPRPVRAELPGQSSLSIGSQLGLRPRPALYDAAMRDLTRLATTLTDRSSGAFVMSDQYDKVLAVRIGRELTLTAPLGAT